MGVVLIPSLFFKTLAAYTERFVVNYKCNKVSERYTMCDHKTTKTLKWMGRQETVCTDCWETTWHEDKPMTWSLGDEVLVTWDGEKSHGKFW